MKGRPTGRRILRTSSSHEEGVVRDWSINTKAFLGDGRVRALRGVRLDWVQDNGRPVMKEIAGSEFDLDCDLVLLALGFLGPESDTVISQLGCELTERGNLKAGPDYQTTVPGVRLRRRAAGAVTRRVGYLGGAGGGARCRRIPDGRDVPPGEPGAVADELVCRYVLRPPVAQQRLRLTGDGRVLVTLKEEWRDGTTHLLLERVELLERARPSRPPILPPSCRLHRSPAARRHPWCPGSD